MKKRYKRKEDKRKEEEGIDRNINTRKKTKERMEKRRNMKK